MKEIGAALGFLASSFLLINLVSTHAESSKNKISVIRIGTRKSDLAMFQTNEVKQLIEERMPHIKVIVADPMEAIGDKLLNDHLRSLSLQTPGLFTKHLEIGLLHNKYDCVVHSLKDMPTRLPDGLCLAAITKRADPRDAFILRDNLVGKLETNSIESLPKGSLIGTSSIRREAILKEQFRDKEFKYKLIRGNVNRRLEKVDAGEYDATILAAAGLERLGMRFKMRISEYLSPPRFLYGVSQGSYGIECLSENKELIKILKEACEHRESSFRCLAERALLRTLEGGCQLPLGVSSEYNIGKSTLLLVARILDENGSKSIEKSCEETVKTEQQATELGNKLARNLLSSGADNILKGLGNYSTGERNISRTITYGSIENPHVEARPKQAMPRHV